MRVGFNAGDAAFWRDKSTYIAFNQPQDAWPAFFRTLIAERKVTDIVLYGDVRSIHANAIEIAKDEGLTVHVFEEGYMRPYWITYERGGSNGNSRLMEMTVPEMREALAGIDQDAPLPPATNRPWETPKTGRDTHTHTHVHTRTVHTRDVHTRTQT